MAPSPRTRWLWRFAPGTGREIIAGGGLCAGALAAAVVRPGGRLLWTDFRPAHKLQALRRALRDAGWETEVEEDMSRNVLRAMEMEDQRWNKLINRQIPRPLRAPFRETAGVKGSKIEQAMGQGAVRYIRSALRKPAGTNARRNVEQARIPAVVD